MSFYWFAWGVGRAVAPLIGGALNGNISPHPIWVGGSIIGLTGTLGLILLSNRLRVKLLVKVMT
jgi:MFS family permease